MDCHGIEYRVRSSRITARYWMLISSELISAKSRIILPSEGSTVLLSSSLQMSSPSLLLHEPFLHVITNEIKGSGDMSSSGESNGSGEPNGSGKPRASGESRGLDNGENSKFCVG